MTATRISSTPGYDSRQSGIWVLRYVWMRSASSWNTVLVVRPHPGQALTMGAKARSPMVCRISCATCTSRVRSPPGSGVSEMRIVSPMPSCSSTDSAAVEATMPFDPMPASVSPRWSAYSQRSARLRYTAIRSCTWLILQEITMRSAGKPHASAWRADSSAERITASRITASASCGSDRLAFSSIMRASSSGSRLPQLTPMRTGLP